MKSAATTLIRHIPTSQKRGTCREGVILMPVILVLLAVVFLAHFGWLLAAFAAADVYPAQHPKTLIFNRFRPAHTPPIRRTRVRGAWVAHFFVRRKKYRLTKRSRPPGGLDNFGRGGAPVLSGRAG
jgi:hypothetical protein